MLSTSELVTLSEIHLSGLRTPVAASVPPTIPQPAVGATAVPVAGLAETVKFEKSLEDLEQEYILATLERTNWNKSQTSIILGIERSTLDRKLKRYGVNRPTTD